MNYEKSHQLLDEIKRAKNIVINCHVSPDPDSVGGSLALFQTLRKMRKNVTVVCPDQIADDVKFLDNSNLIEKINYDTFSFSKFDLFIILDSASWRRVTGFHNDHFNSPIKTIVIDHHITNEQFGDINLIDSKISSNSELLYKIFKDWKIKIDKSTATCLLTGIYGDTYALQHPDVDIYTMKHAIELLEKGAEKEKIIFNLYNNVDLKNMRFWGKVLDTIIFEDKFGFVYSSINYRTFVKYGAPIGAKGIIADLFFKNIKNASFGILMVEENKNELALSFRSKDEKYDVSQLASILGGGGHQLASGATLYDVDYEKGVKKVVEEAKKFAKNEKERK